jgi:hypothetical protein
MPALLSMTLEIFCHMMEHGLMLRPVHNWPVAINDNDLRMLRAKWQLTMLELAPAAMSRG